MTVGSDKDQKFITHRRDIFKIQFSQIDKFQNVEIWMAVNGHNRLGGLRNWSEFQFIAI